MLADASVIIATRNRPAPLRRTLTSLLIQTQKPFELIVVDSSDSQQTELEVERHRERATYGVRFFRSELRSAAVQRNIGAENALGSYLVFIDDDVDLEAQFLEELLQPFDKDGEGIVGGVSGTIVNQTYVQPGGVNFLILRSILGDHSPSWAGRLIGPAVNFLPADEGDEIKRVEWLFSGGVGYRRSVFMEHKFDDSFIGYSFAEDVHLSSRIAKSHALLNTRRARFFHHDMGGATHRDWMELGRSMVINRHKVMVEVLGRTSLTYHVRLFLFEVVYFALVQLKLLLRNPKRLPQVARLLMGKLTAFAQLAVRRSEAAGS